MEPPRPVPRRWWIANHAAILVGALVQLLDAAWLPLHPSEADFALYGLRPDLSYTDHPPLKAWLVETFGMAEWPAFNVADAALVIGVGMFLVHYLFLEDKDEDEAPAEPTDEPAEPTDESVEESADEPEAEASRADG